MSTHSPGRGPHTPRVCNLGFTLVELLIVVVILGLLSGLVAPLVSGPDDAEIAATGQTVRAVREQICIYKARNGDYPPTIDPAWFVGSRPPVSAFWPDHPTPYWVVNQPTKSYPTNKDLRKTSVSTLWYNAGNGQFFARVPTQANDALTIELFNRVNQFQITSLGD